jgi:Protein of unknown function (DUF3551)
LQKAHRLDGLIIFEAQVSFKARVTLQGASPFKAQVPSRRKPLQGASRMSQTYAFGFARAIIGRGWFAFEEAFMRTIAIVSIMFVTLCVPTAGARADGTWCARYPEGASNCGFYSFEQCRATVSGRGGFCEQNPFSSYGRKGTR